MSPKTRDWLIKLYAVVFALILMSAFVFFSYALWYGRIPDLKVPPQIATAFIQFAVTVLGLAGIAMASWINKRSTETRSDDVLNAVLNSRLDSRKVANEVAEGLNKNGSLALINISREERNDDIRRIIREEISGQPSNSDGPTNKPQG